MSVAFDLGFFGGFTSLVAGGLTKTLDLNHVP
jgi:hypothetical protein